MIMKHLDTETYNAPVDLWQPVCVSGEKPTFNFNTYLDVHLKQLF